MLQVGRLLMVVSMALGSACGRSGLTSMHGTGGRVVTSTGGIVGSGGSATETGGAPVIRTGGTVLNGHPWPMAGHDPQGTRRSPVDTSKNEGKLAWRIALGKGQYSSPLISKDGSIVVGSLDHTLFAVAPPNVGAEATIAWSFSVAPIDVPGYPGKIGIGQPALGEDGQVYVHYWDTLYAVSAPASGTEAVVRWSLPGLGKNAPLQSPSLGDDGTVYSITLAGVLIAIDAREGLLKWTMDSGMYGLPAVASAPDGTLYFGQGALSALRPAAVESSNISAWMLPGARVATSPAIGADGTVFVGGNDLRVKAAALSMESSALSIRWSYYTGCAKHWAPAIGLDGTVYVAGHGWDLFALNPNPASQEGELRWRWYHKANSSGLRSSPAVGADGTVFVAGEGMLYAIRPPTSGREGSTKWTFPTEGSLLTSPAIGADGTVYVTDDEGYLYAIR